MNDRARAFENRFNLRFNNITLLTEALTAPGVYSPEGNKGHGLFGDTALQLALQREGRERQQRVERISNVVSAIANNDNLAQRGFALSIDQYTCVNPSQGTYVAPGFMATTMEAIIGAYFLDQECDFAALLRVLAILGLSWPE
ncbi:uncharacterized protein APUU_60106A [Aspergillus puulaauensis]|uniref:RNase III domain-containing protein n=1 Tax=Aspergillus puulaauensis TaxID=1220207 RepID=A0A7R7XUD1_9EURO|nr:uncharacterized protein APUU_60106A [Aspergillus puulaauensis]BCS27058.1 hypothetical protein APUU_60106A [Aspergillus puulaauensis]